MVRRTHHLLLGYGAYFIKYLMDQQLLHAYIVLPLEDILYGGYIEESFRFLYNKKSN